MGKYKPYMLLGAAIVIAIVTSAITYTWLQNKTKVRDVSDNTQVIAVAAVDLPWGTALKKEMIRMAPYLKESVPAGSFSDIPSLENRVLVFPLKADEPIFESRLAPKEINSGGVAAVVKQNTRAMAVKVDKVIGVSGFVFPANRVDVLVTLKRVENTNKPMTKIVLENILVLAAGTEIEKKGKNDKPTQVDVITLEVTPEEAEKLALAVTEGKIQLALRSFSDTERVHTKGATIPSLLASDNNPVKENKAISPRKSIAKPDNKFTVELIRGTKVSTMDFKGGI